MDDFFPVSRRVAELSRAAALLTRALIWPRAPFIFVA
jgi:hypothetical protein